ncbi:hypothetical protein TIFTF001_044403 [Ficus carica]|uniref:Uncharacterized protein n=1 Tax=Ficus carica TaxID=3494 RepID=A0AA88D8A5_FICCA|nr:hypothetical protein TIFTF001_044403 [Ficus carica]
MELREGENVPRDRGDTDWWQKLWNLKLPNCTYSSTELSHLIGKLSYHNQIVDQTGPSAAPTLHSIASNTAVRLLTYSMNVSNELIAKWSCTYLSRYVLLSAASPLGTAAGFLLLVEGHRVNLGLWAKPSNSGTIPGYGP